METQKEERNAVDEAITKAGSQVKLCEVLGVKQQSISLWKTQGWVPLLRAQEIEALYGIPRARLMNPRLRDLVDIEDEVADG